MGRELEMSDYFNDRQIAEIVVIASGFDALAPTPTFDTHVEGRPRKITTTDFNCDDCLSKGTNSCPGKEYCPTYLNNR